MEESRHVRRQSIAGSDEIVVIEDHDPPRRKKKKEKRRSSGAGDEGGYRTVDPDAYGGVVGGRRR